MKKKRVYIPLLVVAACVLFYVALRVSWENTCHRLKSPPELILYPESMLFYNYTEPIRSDYLTNFDLPPMYVIPQIQIIRAEAETSTTNIVEFYEQQGAYCNVYNNQLSCNGQREPHITYYIYIDDNHINNDLIIYTIETRWRSCGKLEDSF